MGPVLRRHKRREIKIQNRPILVEAIAGAAALEIQKAYNFAPFTHGQMHYSLLGRDVERDVVAQAAIAWLLAKRDVTSVLIGASKLNQLDDNLGAANVTLTEAEMAELDAATALSPVYPNWFIERLQDEVTTKALAR